MSLLRHQSVETASTVYRPITSKLYLLYKTRALITSFSLSSDNIMKKFTLSDDKTVVVKKIKGQLAVVVNQKDSDTKFAEFSPNRYVA